MRWLLLVAGALVVLVLIVAVIGLMLPRAHRATRTASFSRPPEDVFAAIIGPQDWRGVTRLDLPADGGQRKWREETGHRSITFEEVASDRPRLYCSRIADADLPFSGTWTWEIAATRDGCTCRITEEGEIKNPVFRFISRFILGQTKTIDDGSVYLTQPPHRPPPPDYARLTSASATRQRA